MKNKVHAFLLTGIWLLGVSLAAVAADAPKKEKCPGRVTVMLETVQPAPFVEYARLSGKAQPEVVALPSPVAGLVSEIKVVEGSLVDAGQELAVLNAGMDERVKALEDEAARRKKILTARQNWKEKSERAIQSAEKDYQSALSELEAARSKAGRTIQAPLAGIVRLKTTSGAEVEEGDLLFEIVDPLNLWIDFPVASDVASLFMAGETVSVTAGELPGEMEATVVSTGDQKVRLRLPNPQGRLREGLAIQCRRLKSEVAEAIAVPGSAVQKDSLGDFVFIAEKNRARKLYVTLAAADAGLIRVEKGLETGAQLIVSGFECLADNKKIKAAVQPKPAAVTSAVGDEPQKQRAEAAEREQEAKKAAAEADRQKKQADADARAAARALKEKEKQDKLAAKKAAAEAAKAARAEKKKAAAAAQKPACPKKLSVLAEVTRLETFREYGYYTAPAMPETISVIAPASGLLHALRVQEGAAVQPGQELLAFTVGESEEVARLRLDAERRLKTLVSRREAAVKNERAIQAAERDYQKALDQLEQKAAPFAQALAAPVSGVVQGLQAAPGSEITASAPLLEIVTGQRLLVSFPLAAGSARFVRGESVSGTFKELDGEFSAEVVESDSDRVVLRLDNSSGRIKAGSLFTARQLKVEHADAVSVPAAAVQQDGLGDFVYVVEKKKARKIYVRKGASEAGRTMLATGLGSGATLILSGFDCLAEGKKVIVVDEEQLAREKEAAAVKAEEAPGPAMPGIDEFIAYLEANREALGYDRYERTESGRRPAVRIVSSLETQKQLLELLRQYSVAEVSMELKEERVVSTIIFKTPARLPKERPARVEKAGLFGGRLSLAVHGTYYMMFDENFKESYVSLGGFGGELAFRLAKMDIWVSGGLAMKKNTPEWSPDEMKFTLIPLSAALRYYFVEKDKLSAYVGAGPIVFLVKDVNPAGDIKTTLIGANALVGGNYKLSRKLFAQLFVKFNLAQKDLYPESDLDDPLNLTGLEFNLGIGIRL